MHFESCVSHNYNKYRHKWHIAFGELSKVLKELYDIL